MIFAFATDDKTLTVFPDEKAAIGYCEGWDVSEGGWLFFTADGCPMDAIFSEPAFKSSWVISPGRYSLRPIAAAEKSQLLLLLPMVSAVQGEAPFNTVEAIKELLAPR